ncbi:HDOD domain-containing protein [Rhodocyclaceae bacterium SMB388]
MNSFDKKGEELKRERFRMLEDIAVELSGDVVFPTYFDSVLRLRNALRDQAIDDDSVVSLIRTEPLVSARLIHHANAASKGSRQEVRDLTTAIDRLGIDAVRNTALTVVMNQLVRSKELVLFHDMSRTLWQHSLYCSAAAEVIARELSDVDPDEASLTGLIHDLGAFYMLYRAAQYADLRARPDTVRYLVAQWHDSIGETLLTSLKLPAAAIEAVRLHDQPRPPLMEAPRTMSDVIYAANTLARAEFEWLEDGPIERILGDQYHALRAEIEEHFDALQDDYVAIAA